MSGGAFRITGKHLIIGALAVLILIGGLFLYLRSSGQNTATNPSGIYPTTSVPTAPSGPSQTGTVGSIGPNQIGYVGCSNTWMSVEGYHNAAGNKNLFWDTKGLQSSGVTIIDWANPSGKWWTSLDRKIQQSGQPKIVWIQLCDRVISENDTYDTVKQLIANVRQHIPSAVFYISPLNSYNPPNTCLVLGSNGEGVTNGITWSNQATADGLAKRGPDLGPLTPSDILPTDTMHCHPTDQARATIIGPQLVNFFDHL